jgi:putative ABC transport system permease protein
MFKVAVVNVWAHRRRLLSTFVAVVLGVAFLSGTLILSDTITKTFNDLLGNAYSGTDALVRSTVTNDNAGGGGGGGGGSGGDNRQFVSADLASTIGTVNGVAAAEPLIKTQGVLLLDKQNQPIGGGRGQPTYGSNWLNDAQLNTFHLVAGVKPTAADDVVVDKAAADQGKFQVGDTIGIAINGAPEPYRLVGIARFGSQDSQGPATDALFSLATAKAKLVSSTAADNTQLGAVPPDPVTAILIRGQAGVSQTDLATRVASVLPARIEAITGAQVIADARDNIQARIAGFTKFLQFFGYIAVLVGTFVIYNTFTIVLAQRARETALLRAVGASRRQVLGSVLAEAVLIGLAASAVGVVGGAGVAKALQSLLSFSRFGNHASLALSLNTVLVGFAIGIVTTVVAAVLPAIRAARVPPVAAMRDIAIDTSAASRTRLGASVVLLAASVAITTTSAVDANFTVGAFDQPKLLGVGAFLFLMGMIALGPFAARQGGWILAAPVARYGGIAGSLARDNATRNPRRTSTTALALLIGVTVVTFFVVIAASLKATANDEIDKTFVGGDLVVNPTNFRIGLSPEITPALAKLPQIDTVAPLRNGTFTLDGKSTDYFATDPAAIQKLMPLAVQSGRLTDLDQHSIAISVNKAKDTGWGVGTELPASWLQSGTSTVKVVAVYTSNDIVGDFLLNSSADNANVAKPRDRLVFMKLRSGTDPTAARAAVQSVADQFPPARVSDIGEVRSLFTNQIDQLLRIILAMLGLAILIAVIGISNTLQLSVHERTREIGLLRAVGMSRRQLGTAVRWESTIVALFGTVGGFALGAGFSAVMITSLNTDTKLIYALPTGSAALILVAGALVGVLAGALPARAAARLNILSAINTE